MRKLPVKKQVIKLNSEFEGWEFEARTNPTMKDVGNLASGDFDRIVEALAKLVFAWNFVDENGENMPKPSVDTIGELPMDLATKMTEEIVKAAQQLPKG